MLTPREYFRRIEKLVKELENEIDFDIAVLVQDTDGTVFNVSNIDSEKDLAQFLSRTAQEIARGDSEVIDDDN